MTNEFVPLKDKRVTGIEFQDWFGSDHCENWKDLTELILQLVNAEYSVDTLRGDIKSYAENN